MKINYCVLTQIYISTRRQTDILFKKDMCRRATVARRAHNPKVAGSSPAGATTILNIGASKS